MAQEQPSAEGKIRIAADADTVYAAVSDPVLMASLADELHQVEWTGSARSGVGARFTGHNRNGMRRWSTQCVVTQADAGRRFGYDVSLRGLIPISHWQYDIDPVDDGCVVTERSWTKAPLWFLPFALAATGIPNRDGANAQHIDATLERLKDHCERQSVGS